ncbi:diguanylate phosphodiesterase [Pokkaliibacter plantistimulans]|uniref:Diguanylate phosphodiesterase n=1 Tax=Proteobacteria bacterium 228 TaxID=2083153 RepID=A0A2S5KS68_9PROT|nr:diguanylate phosphodiesterase [Pokkaliibacter plantistimulans]
MGGAYNVLIARQPIFDAKLRICGYELLFRSQQDQHQALFDDPDGATRDVIINNFMAIWDTGSKNRVFLPAYINLGRQFILSHQIPDLPRDQVVLEVLENAGFDQLLFDALVLLKKDGYTLALDDFVYTPAKKPFVQLADIIKLDVLALGVEEVGRQIELLKPFGKRILAEKVETADELEQCKALGCHLFQGYFLSRPTLTKGKRIPASASVLLRTLDAISKGAGSAEVEQIIRMDPGLTYKLLRLINSAQFAFVREITSVRETVNLLGRIAMKKWLTMLLTVCNEQCISEQIVLALTRARMCELLAEQKGEDTADAFILGILSSLEMLYGVSISQILQDLPLDDRLSKGMKGVGALGELLLITRAYEREQWNMVERLAKAPYDPGTAYMESVGWAGKMAAGLI